jgi:hypothetical protein
MAGRRRLCPDRPGTIQSMHATSIAALPGPFVPSLPASPDPGRAGSLAGPSLTDGRGRARVMAWFDVHGLGKGTRRNKIRKVIANPRKNWEIILCRRRKMFQQVCCGHGRLRRAVSARPCTEGKQPRGWCLPAFSLAWPGSEAPGTRKPSPGVLGSGSGGCVLWEPPALADAQGQGQGEARIGKMQGAGN